MLNPSKTDHQQWSTGEESLDIQNLFLIYTRNSNIQLLGCFEQFSVVGRRECPQVLQTKRFFTNSPERTTQKLVKNTGNFTSM